jgi:hypothetical protein
VHRLGRMAGWPERGAVRQYLAALWRHVLGVYPCTPDPDATLCGIGGAEDDLGPYLGAGGRRVARGRPAPRRVR